MSTATMNTAAPGTTSAHDVMALVGRALIGYLFIPAGVPHVAVNRCSEDAEFLGARNDAAANESVVLMPELDEIVP